MSNKLPPQYLAQSKLPTDQQQITSGRHVYGPYAPAGIFSTNSHDNLVRTKGFKATHWRAALSPHRTTLEGGADLSKLSDVGQMNMYDPRQMYVAIQNLSWQDRYVVQGVHGNFSVLTANYTSYYENEPEVRVYLKKFDVIVIDNGHTVMVNQLAEYKPAGPQRLKFPIVEIDYLADNDGNRYEQGIDFVIINGMIEWIGNRRPMWDAKNGRGAVMSINYWTKPYFSVIETPRIMREVFTNAAGDAGTESQATYVAGSVVLKAIWLDDAFQGDLPEWPRYTEAERSQLTRS